MRVIAIANQKGGCGKTTTSINLSACLAYLGKKVLLIDLDPQGHSTCGVGVGQSSLENSIYEVLSPGERVNSRLTQVFREIEQNLFLVPATGSGTSLEEELVNLPDRDKRLKQELVLFCQEVADFDYALIDCPPNLSVLTRNALEAADDILIPIEPSFFSLHGLAKISETLKRINTQRDRPLAIHALLTLFDSRTSFSREVYEEVFAHFKEKLFKTIVHDNVDLKEAASAGRSIVQYNQASIGFQDYFNLAVEYLEREWNRLLPERTLGWDQVVHERYGPRRVSGGILFQLLSKQARTVEIAGDFNQWIPESLVFREEGLWQKVMVVPPGNYRYKFIVDGEWQIDPVHPVQQMNSYGSYDSLLEVR